MASTCGEADLGGAQRGDHDKLVDFQLLGSFHERNGAVSVDVLGVAEIEGLALGRADRLHHLRSNSRFQLAFFPKTYSFHCWFDEMPVTVSLLSVEPCTNQGKSSHTLTMHVQQPLARVNDFFIRWDLCRPCTGNTA